MYVFTVILLSILSISSGHLFGVDGDCETYDNGRCFRTKTDDNGRYAPRSACTITANANVTLNVTSFVVEDRSKGPRGETDSYLCIFDFLRIFFNNYCGSELTGNPEWVSPHGVQVLEGDEMTWRSDNVINKGGFEICGECAAGFFYDGICRSCHSIDIINGTCKECADATTCTMVDYDCSLPNAVCTACYDATTCSAFECAEGYENVDGNATNGCECSASTIVIPNGVCQACSSDGTCSAFECVEGYENADGNATNGCESNCPSTIVIPNAVCTACSSDGTCSAVECDSGYIDSDGDPLNGCEGFNTLGRPFQIVSGHDYCETYDNGRCFRTIANPSDSSKYLPNGDCRIRAMANITLKVNYFAVEPDILSCQWDYLRLCGTQSNNISVWRHANMSADIVGEDTLVTSQNLWPNNCVDFCGAEGVTGGSEYLALSSPSSSVFGLPNGLKLDGFSLDMIWHSDGGVEWRGIDICAGVECDAGKFDSDGDMTNGCESDYECMTIDVHGGRCTKCSDEKTCLQFECDAGKFNSDGDAQNGCESDNNCNAIVSSTTACDAEEGCDINMVDSVCTLCAPKWRYLNHNYTLAKEYHFTGSHDQVLVCEKFESKCIQEPRELDDEELDDEGEWNWGLFIIVAWVLVIVVLFALIWSYFSGSKKAVRDVFKNKTEEAMTKNLDLIF